MQIRGVVSLSMIVSFTDKDPTPRIHYLFLRSHQKKVLLPFHPLVIPPPDVRVEVHVPERPDGHPGVENVMV